MNRAIKKSVWRRGTRAGVSRTNRQRDGSPGSRCRPLLFRCPFERLRGKKRRGGHTTTALLIGFLSSLSTGRLGEGGHESHSGDRKESGDPKYAGFRRKHTGLAHLETVSGWPLLLFDGRRCIATLSCIYILLFSVDGATRHKRIIKSAQPDDAGYYMAQINSHPMKSQVQVFPLANDLHATTIALWLAAINRWLICL